MNRRERRAWGQRKGQPVRAKTGKATPHPLAAPKDENGRAIRLAPGLDEVWRFVR